MALKLTALKDLLQEDLPLKITVIGATDDCDAEGVDGEMADFQKVLRVMS